ncbi:MAG TPA: DUF1573 domain-containing protein [Planctomycetota bacterium]|nr:DUF1573 domain-containing protein [Planctomycetota bacterium]
MTVGARWISIAIVLGLCTSYFIWGRNRVPPAAPATPRDFTAQAQTSTPESEIPKHGAGALKFNPDEIDFGVVPVNESRTATQQLTNPTDKTITIRGLSGSCGCMTVDATSLEIPPGKSTTLNYRIKALAGKKTHELSTYFRSNEAGDPYYTNKVYISVKEEILVDPNPLNFGHANKHEPKVLEFTVRSEDGKPFELKTVAASKHDFTFKWERPPGGDGSVYNVKATLVAEKGGMLNDTAAVVTDRQRAGTMPLYMSAQVKPDLTCEPMILVAQMNSARIVDTYTAVLTRTTPGELKVLDIVDSNPAPNNLPLDFVVDRLSESSCRLSIKFKGPYPKRAPFGHFRVKTNVEEQDFDIPFRVNSSPDAPAATKP